MAEFRDVRCTCAHRTLLAKVMLDPVTGEPAIHVKALKRGARAPLELFLVDGTARLRCRDCLRWYEMSVRAGGKIRIHRVREDIDCGIDSEPSIVPANRYGHRTGTSFDT